MWEEMSRHKYLLSKTLIYYFMQILDCCNVQHEKDKIVCIYLFFNAYVYDAKNIIRLIMCMHNIYDVCAITTSLATSHEK